MKDLMFIAYYRIKINALIDEFLLNWFFSINYYGVLLFSDYNFVTDQFSANYYYLYPIIVGSNSNSNLAWWSDYYQCKVFSSKY